MNRRKTREYLIVGGHKRAKDIGQKESNHRDRESHRLSLKANVFSDRRKRRMKKHARLMRKKES